MFQVVTNLVSIRGSMGMDTGIVTGKGDAVTGDKPVREGGEDSVFQGIRGQLVGNAGMLTGKFLPLAGFFRRF